MNCNTTHYRANSSSVPGDPTYWKTGRELEATFQWKHARDAKPEPEELAKIEDKLKNGLKDDTQSAAAPKSGSGG